MITIGIVDNDRFALPMLDMPLTDIPGPEICRRVRAASADIVVLGITSYSLDHYRQLAIDAGAQGLIAKSVTPKELAEAMRNVLVLPFPGFPTTEQAHGSIVSASARRSRTLSKREREVLGLYADNYSTQYNARNTRTASDRAATSSLTFACRTTTDTVESAIPRRSAISAVE